MSEVERPGVLQTARPLSRTERLIFRTEANHRALAAIYDQKLAEWPVPFDAFYVDTRYGKTHVIACGAPTSPPLVLTHPAGCASFVWSSIIAALSHSHRTYALDTIGELGKSRLDDHDHYPTTGRDYSAWLDDVSGELGIDASDVVAGSMGAWIALNRAIIAPERVRRLVLLGPMGLPSWPATLRVLGQITSVVLHPTDAKLKKMTRRCLGDGEHVKQELYAWTQIALRCHARTGQPLHIPAAKLHLIRSPTLVFLGEKDGLIGSATAAAKRARNIPDCEIEILPRAGHIMNVDEPELVGTRTATFLAAPVQRPAHGTAPSRALAQKEMMNAIVQLRYGSPDVVRVEEVDKPVVKADEVLVRVRAAAVNIGDWHLLRGVPYVMRLVSGLQGPRHGTPGLDIAGQVDAVGGNVRQLRPGDEVFGWCRGAFAEYACTGEKNLLLKPANLTFEQSAAVGDSAFTALSAVRDQGMVQPGQRVLVNGASGGVGTFAVQIAKSFGANVTGVCGTRNLDMVRSIGADQVIDYTREDFTQSAAHYDVMLDLVGNRSLSDCRRALTPRGTYVVVGVKDMGRWFGLGRQFKALSLSPFVGQRMRVFVVRHNKEDLAVLKELAEIGKVAPVIDRHFSLSDVSDALRYQGEGHPQGKIVIVV